MGEIPGHEENPFRIRTAGSFKEFGDLIRDKRASKITVMPGGRFEPHDKLIENSSDVVPYGTYVYFITFSFPTAEGPVVFEDIVASRQGYQSFFKKVPQFDSEHPAEQALRTIKTAQARLGRLRRRFRRLNPGDLKILFKNHDAKAATMLLEAASSDTIKPF